MIQRNLASQLELLSRPYPVVTVTGPRQSRKTTLARAILPDWTYVSLETPEQAERLLPIEIRSGKTVSEDYFKGLRFWSRISGTEAKDTILVYAGVMDQKRKEGQVLSWRSFGKVLPLEI